MKTFNGLIKDCIDELKNKEKVEELKKKLIDFGFEETGKFDTGTKLELPDNPLFINMVLFVDDRGWVGGHYGLDFLGNDKYFRLYFTKKPVDKVFDEVVSYLEKLTGNFGE